MLIAEWLIAIVHGIPKDGEIEDISRTTDEARSSNE